MITRFSLYERDSLFPHKRVYWKMNRKRPEFLIQMWKIGMSDNMIKIFDRTLDDNDENVYLYYDGKDLEENFEYLNWKFSRNRKVDDYQFLGQVYLTDKDIEEYNLDQDAKKYNL